MRLLFAFALLMATSAKVGAFNVNDGGASVGNTNAINVGFQPTAIIFWWSGRSDSVDANGGADSKMGVGFAVSTTARSAASLFDQDAAATSNCERTQSAAAMVCERLDGANGGLLDLNSIDANGFTTIIDAAFTTNLRVHYLALGGDVSAAAEGTISLGATGNVSVTGLSFQPKAVLLLSHGGAAANGAGIGLGAATGTANEACVSIGMQNGAASSDTASYGFGDECAALNNYSSNGEPPFGRAEFVQFNSDGFTINVLEIGTNARYLALGGAASFLVRDFLTRTDTTQFSESGFGFTPKATLFASCCTAECVQNTATASGQMSIGAATSASERGAHATTSQDALADTEVWTAVSHDEVYVNGDLADGVEGEMDLVSMDSDGFTVVMDDADPVAAFVWYLAIGDVAAAGGVPMGTLPMMGVGK